MALASRAGRARILVIHTDRKRIPGAEKVKEPAFPAASRHWWITRLCGGRFAARLRMAIDTVSLLSFSPWKNPFSTEGASFSV
ncbi:hypothetical protein [Streptomyces albus]|uniref:hypothetical protein n=1 Tax=Streptomyces albus TaxID=1888 RepID=UPI0006E18D52|nr:hypothetical protein [Streptomyces albus]